MKKQIVLIISLIAFMTVSLAQKPIKTPDFTGVKVPSYCASGDTTRTPIFFQAKISGRAVNTKYKYYVSFIAISDTSSSSTTGVGNDFLFRTNGKIVYSNAPAFSPGNHDTLTIGSGGIFTGWFGALNTNDTRFTPGKYIYPMIVMQEIKSGSPPIEKYYLGDSVKVLGYSTTGGGNNCTGLYGNSFTNEKNLVLLYDDTAGTSSRPVTIAYVESDGNTVSSMPHFYNVKVDGKRGNWGTIIPNALAKGIRRIESRNPYAGNTFLYANKELDATWGNDSTINQHGGFKQIINIKSDYAPLLAPEIQFVKIATNVIEATTTLKIAVIRKYGNTDTSKVSFSVLSGTATQGLDYTIDTTKKLKFKPYGNVADTIYVNILADNIVEQPEFINLKLTKPVSGNLGLNKDHKITIFDPLKPVNNLFFDGIKIPQYCASGDTSRTPLFFQAKITGFAPNSKFRYFTSFIVISDTASSSSLGAGANLFFKANGNMGYSAAPDFSPGNHDTLTIDVGGEFTGWFGGLTTNDIRFTAGKSVYPMIVMQLVDSLVQPIQKYYLRDSIHVLKYNASAGSNNGTAIYGNSFAGSKNLVALYDDVLGNSIRPIAITYLENDGNTVAKMPYFYSSKVNGVNGAWGTIIPNSLSKGIKRIEVKDPKSGFAFLYANKELDATWGADSTINPHGGFKAINIKSNYAPLVAPDLQFTSTVTNVNEANTTVKLSVRRRYGNDDTTKVSFFVVAGTATLGLDYNINTAKTLVFQPYGDIIDSTTITVDIIDDIISDPNETISVKLTNPQNGFIGTQSTNTIVIIDNDIPVIFFDKKGITVGEAVGVIKIKVKMNTGSSGPTDFRLFVKYKSDSTLVPTEFKLGSNNKDTLVTFAGGKLKDSLDIKLNIINDNIPETYNDTIIFALRSPTAPATIGKDSLFTLVIIDDDAPPKYSFDKKTVSVKENAGSVKFKINVKGRNLNQSDVALKFISSLSSATEGQDLTFNPTTKILTVLPTDLADSIIITLPILNNNLHEPTETALFILSPFLNSWVGKPDTLRVLILDDDIVEYPISKVTTSKVLTGVADSLNTKCKLRGLVYGVNLQPTGTPNGFLFTLIDGTGGIQVINSTGNKGYTVTEGDSIYVIGTIGQSAGMVQLQNIDSLVKLASGRGLRKAVSISILDETTESKLVKLNVVKLANISQWPTTAMAANTFVKVKLVNQTDSFTLYIDSETDIDGTPAPIGFIGVTGLGGQSDITNPFTSNYHIAPRRLTDIVTIVSPTFNFLTRTTNTFENKDSTKGFVLMGTNLTDPEQISVEIIGGTASRTGATPDYQATTTTRTFNLTPAQPSVVIKVKLNDDAIPENKETIFWAIRGNQFGTIIGADSLHTDTILDDETMKDGIRTNRLATETKLYPNPAKNVLNINTTAVIYNITIIDITGRIVLILNEINELDAIINTEKLSKGVYTIAIVTAKGTVTKSFSKIE